ncbi:MAG: NAD(P)-dependent oxidoreductase [Burkholderiaceae bacterium]
MPDIAALGGRRLFLTGATGFVGRTLLDHFAALAVGAPGDFEVCGLSRDPQAFLARFPQYAGLRWFTLRRGDVLDPPAPDGRFTDVIHAAADTHSAAGARAWIRQIVDGTAAAIDFACAAGAERFLHTSSGAVYGPQPAGLARIPEDHPGAPATDAPTSVYGQAKRVAEQLCTAAFAERGLGAVNARCFAFVGRHLPLDGPYAMGNFLRDALFADAITVHGDGRAVRSYLDGRDLAHWLLRLLRDGAAGQSYNVGSDEAVTTRELAGRVAAVVAPGKPVVVRDAATDAGARSLYVPCVAKAAALGLRRRIDLDTAIADAAEALPRARLAR